MVRGRGKYTMQTKTVRKGSEEREEKTEGRGGE